MPEPLDFNPARPATLVQVVSAVLTRPRQFFAEMPSTGWLPPLAFLVALHLISTLPFLLGAYNQPGGLAAWLFNLAYNLLQAYIFATLLYWITRLVAKSGDFSMPAIFRVFAYGTSVWLFNALGVFLAPGLQMMLFGVVAVVSLYLVFVGVQVVARLSIPMAAASVLITVVASLLLFAAVFQVARS